MKGFVIFSIVLLFSTVSHGNNTIKLKQQILKISKQNTTITLNQDLVRAEIDVLVQQLQQLEGPVTEVAYKQYAPGSWRQIWSDEKNNDQTSGPTQDLERIYQYVNANGRALNFGVRILPDGRRVTFSLGVEASIKDNVQATKIVSAYLREADFTKGETLDYFAHDIFSGTYQYFQPTKAGTFPNGPINAQSDLTILFLDQDMKIGVSPNVFTGQSEMFVLERISSID